MPPISAKQLPRNNYLRALTSARSDQDVRSNGGNHTAKQIVLFRAKNYRQLPNNCERVFTINNNCIDQGSLKRNCLFFRTRQLASIWSTWSIWSHEIFEKDNGKCLKSLNCLMHFFTQSKMDAWIDNDYRKMSSLLGKII